MTQNQDKPEAGKIYNLTGFANGGPSIAKGNTWAESEVPQFEIFCTECGKSIGRTDCEITATSMALCEPCQDQD